MKYVRSIFFWALISATTLMVFECFAQDEFEEIPEEQKLYFTVMAFGNDMFQDIMFEDVYKRRLNLDFKPDARSQFYVVPLLGKRIRFFRELVDEEGRMIDSEVAVANVSEISKQALLVFLDIRDRETGNPYTVYVASESPSDFGPGAFRFLNLSGAPIMWRIGNESALVDFGFSKTILRDPTSPTFFPIQLAVRHQDAWNIVFSTKTVADPGYGTLYIIKPPIDPNSLKVRVKKSKNRMLVRYHDSTGSDDR